MLVLYYRKTAGHPPSRGTDPEPARGGTRPRPRPRPPIRHVAGPMCSRWSRPSRCSGPRRDRRGDPAAAGVLQAEPGGAGHRRRLSLGLRGPVGTGRPWNHLCCPEACAARCLRFRCRPERKQRGEFRAPAGVLGSPPWPRRGTAGAEPAGDPLPRTGCTPLGDAEIPNGRRGPRPRTPGPQPAPPASVPVAYFPPWLIGTPDSPRARGPATAGAVAG